MNKKSLGLYATTPINESGYLDILNIRSVPSAGDDVLYEITTAYTYRPDLLAYDIYGSKDLWWVFAQRNLDILKDPIFDFVAGMKIYIPNIDTIRNVIGNR